MFERAKKAAWRHSLFVRVLKVLLPLAGVVTAIGVVGFIFLQNVLANFNIGELSLTTDGLVMSNPHLTGNDGERSYSVKANRAIQRITNPQIIDLEGISANLVLDREQSATVTAKEGTYNAQDETLSLRLGVKISYSQGYSAFFEYLDIDMNTGRFVTQDKVAIQSDGGYIDAGNMAFDQKKSVLKFSNGVQMKLFPSMLEDKK
ncbi:LPS export ABC transporter periplasmic protein LptC [Polycladidibacter hongkongensis]|uniref:LPS export ABC transporter periplasmic protein LptC n=1 Tax=Polycladidibacter hongkongensis TaxID=1647556 RepID=UPI001AD8FE87|nr:LPS export ABC transporter periplasmic protein LptC [Pseudovibrio hongkongensis]